MAEEIDVENGRNSNFEGLVTLTLTFDRAIRHIVLHQSSTSTYIPNFIQIEETFVDGRTYGRTDISPLYIIRSTLGSRPNNKRPSTVTGRNVRLSNLLISSCCLLFCLRRISNKQLSCSRETARGC